MAKQRRGSCYWLVDFLNENSLEYKIRCVHKAAHKTALNEITVLVRLVNERIGERKKIRLIYRSLSFIIKMRITNNLGEE